MTKQDQYNQFIVYATLIKCYSLHSLPLTLFSLPPHFLPLPPFSFPCLLPWDSSLPLSSSPFFLKYHPAPPSLGLPIAVSLPPCPSFRPLPPLSFECNIKQTVFLSLCTCRNGHKAQQSRPPSSLTHTVPSLDSSISSSFSSPSLPKIPIFFSTFLHYSHLSPSHRPSLPPFLLLLKSHPPLICIPYDHYTVRPRYNDTWGSGVPGFEK